jgi:maleamate amidohydrolase
MASNWLDRYPDIKEFYGKRLYGEPIGFGKVPAIIVIDFGLAWTDKTGESPFGADLDEAVENTLKILKVARAMKPKPPIIFTIMTYNAAFTDVSPLMIKKIPASKQVCVEGSKWDKIDPRLEQQADEPRLVKKKGSCFWGTPLSEILVGNHVDTLIITGCTTDSCVRATALASFHHGYYTIIPFEAVGSRDPEQAKWALLDMSLRYGDVVSTQDVIDYLKRLKERW